MSLCFFFCLISTTLNYKIFLNQKVPNYRKPVIDRIHTIIHYAITRSTKNVSYHAHRTSTVPQIELRPRQIPDLVRARDGHIMVSHVMCSCTLTYTNYCRENLPQYECYDKINITCVNPPGIELRTTP